MVHPHMRGENYYDSKTYEAVNGTPPHAWGEC